MDFLEKDLETILYETPQELVRDRGLGIFNYDQIFRQVQIGNYGIADIITVSTTSKWSNIMIYELKNKLVNTAAFWQLIRYMRGIEWFIEQGNLRERFSVYGVLVGRDMDMTGELCYIPEVTNNIKIYTYDYKMTGMNFSRVNGFHLKNPSEINFERQGFSSARDFLKTLIPTENVDCF